jgi:hypothetical protein
LCILDTKDYFLKEIKHYCQNYKNDIKILRNLKELDETLKLYDYNNYNKDICINFAGHNHDIHSENIKGRNNTCKNCKIIIITDKANLKKESISKATTLKKFNQHHNITDIICNENRRLTNTRGQTNNIAKFTGDYKNLVYLRPKNLVIGIGCNKNTSFEEIEQFVIEIFSKRNLSLGSIRNTATIDIKNEENGILLFSKKYADFIDFYSKEEINNFIDNFNQYRILKDMSYGYNSSCYKYTGAYSVCEPSALLSSKNKELFICKKKKGNVTIAVALAK